MDSGTVVVDISSDDEPDGFTVDKPLDDWVDKPIDDWINSFHKENEDKDADDIVLLDACFNVDGNGGRLRAKGGEARENSDDDCLILEEDPDKPVGVAEDQGSGGDESDDLLIVGQKGKVACRDFPHSRHLCANFPFNSTSHEKHCKLCHCYVCDSPAPCIYWGNGFSLTDHCHATDKIETWNMQRKSLKKITSISSPLVSPSPARVTEAIRHRRPVPPPIQPYKTNSLHPCTTTLRNTPSYTQTPQYYQHPSIIAHRRQNQTNSQQVRPHGEKRGSSTLVRSIMQSHQQFKSVGIPKSYKPKGSQYTSSNSTPRLPVGASPISAYTPVNSHVSSNIDVSLSGDESGKWQDILASVASELGVADCISRTSVATQTNNTDSSQLLNSDMLQIPCQKSPETMPSNLSGLESGWIDPMVVGLSYSGGFEGGQQLSASSYGNGNGNGVSPDVNIGSILGSVPGKELGMPVADPTSLLYEIESSSWSSIANV